jgi:hypothetical protein
MDNIDRRCRAKRGLPSEARRRMFDGDLFQTLAACCTVCSVYTIVLEHVKLQQANGAYRVTMTLHFVQSVYHTLYGLVTQKLYWSLLWICKESAIYYAASIWFPIAAQYFGVDSLTLLLLRSSGPIMTCVLQETRLRRTQWLGIALATLATLTASIGLFTIQGIASYRGNLCCLLGTVAACQLNIEQSRLVQNKRVTREEQLEHMHAACLVLSLVASWLFTTAPATAPYGASAR